MGPLEIPRDQRRQRREHQCRADPFEDRPTQRQDRHRLRHGSQRRAAGIDDQADHERPAAADHVADLGSGEDQHRHHQAVEGDDGLDRGHGGVEVRDQLTDRHVHHGLVEHHEELRRGQGDQCRPALVPSGLADRLARHWLGVHRGSPGVAVGGSSPESVMVAPRIVATTPGRPHESAARDRQRCRSRTRLRASARRGPGRSLPRTR